MRYHVLCLGMTCVLMVSSAAVAHHPVEPPAQGVRALGSSLGGELSLTGFSFSEIEGHYWTLGARAKWAPFERLALGLLVPAHYLIVSGADEHVGLGDLELGSMFRLTAQEHFRLDVGLNAEVPLGDHDHGLGSGHLELAPFVAAALLSGGVGLHGRVAISHSFSGHEDGHEHEVTLQVVNPHRETELLGTAGAIWFASEWLNVAAGVELRTVLSSEERGLTAVTLLPELGAELDSWRFSLGAGVPITERYRQYDWRVIVAARLVF